MDCGNKCHSSHCRRDDHFVDPWSMFALILLGYSSHALERVAVAVEHQLLKRPDLTVVVPSFGLENALSQIENSPIDGVPVDGIPVGVFLGFDCRGLHLSAPRFAFFTVQFKRFTRPTSASFWSRRMPYPAGYLPVILAVSLCLSAAGLRFSGRPVPAEDVSLPCGRHTSVEDLNGVSTFRIGEVRPGRALPILRGLGVREHGGNEPCPLTHPPLASIHGGSSMTKPQREFNCVRPFGLSLACGSVMVGCSWASALGFAPRRCQQRTPG